MTVQTTSARLAYAGNGSTVAFSIPFYFLDNTHLKVILTDAAGNQTTKTLTTDYTATGAGVSSGGTLTMVVAPAAGQTLTIIRDPIFDQAIDYQPNDPFPAQVTETALDKLTMIAQRLADKLARTFTLSDGDNTGASVIVPTPAANKLLGWNTSGNALQNYDPASIASVALSGNYTLQTFTGNGSTTAFTLSVNPGSINNTLVHVNGTYQPKSLYTLSGVTLTFNTAPANGATIEVISAGAIALGSVPNNGVTTVTILDAAVTAAKLAAGAAAANLGSYVVSVNGQSGVVTVSTLTFKGAWSSATAYVLNDVVTYNGDSYISIQAGTNRTPSAASAYWSYLTQGASSILTTSGDMIYNSGSGPVRLPVGSANQNLTVDPTTLIPAWKSVLKPASTVWVGSGTANGMSKPRCAWAGTDGGTHAAFIMSDQKRIKTVGRSIYGCGLYNNTADVSCWHPQDAILNTPLATGEYFVGVREANYCVAAWTNLGSVYTGGYNNVGQLGLGDTNNRPYLAKVTYFSSNSLSVTKVVIGACLQWGAQTSMFFLCSNGQMYATGYNATGQLGNGTTTNQSTPVRCGTITGITDFDVGQADNSAVYAWTAAGALYVWGQNTGGGLGVGDTTNRTGPVLSSLTGVKYVRASGGSNGVTGYNRAYGLKTDGTVWATGQNTEGQLGVGDNTARSSWTQCAGSLVNVRDIYVGQGFCGTVFAITNSTGTNANQTYCWGNSNSNSSTLWQADTAARNTPVLFGQTSGNAQNWAAFWPFSQGTVSCVYGLKTDGTWWFAGYTVQASGCQVTPGVDNALTQCMDFGKYGITDIMTMQIDGSSGGQATYFLTASGEVLAAGSDGNGQLASSNSNISRGMTAIRF